MEFFECQGPVKQEPKKIWYSSILDKVIYGESVLQSHFLLDRVNRATSQALSPFQIYQMYFLRLGQIYH